MTPRAPTPTTPSLRTEWGLVRPRTGWITWLSDTHVLAALAAAVPMWAGLGLMVADRMQAPASTGAWLSLLLLQPLTEELLFRGALQGMLLRRTGRRMLGPLTRANAWTTAAFVALHFIAQPPGWAVAVALPSLVFGHMRDRFDSLLPSVLLHVVYNAGFGLTAWWIHR